MTELIDATECAKRLHVTYGGLAVARCRKRWGLPYIKIGRRIWYRESDIEKFLLDNLHPGDGPQAPQQRRKRSAK